MVALVEGSRLEEARGRLDDDTAHSHVYSVQPAQPKARPPAASEHGCRLISCCVLL